MAAREILDRATRRQIELVLPFYALVEPAEALRRRHADMREFADTLRAQLREVERMAHTGLAPGTHTDLAKTVFDALNDWPARLHTYRQEIVRVARLLPLDWPTVERAQDMLQQGLIKREPDALMLAAVLIDAESQKKPSLFLNKNRKDFNQGLRSLLSPLDCQAVGLFQDGLARLDALATRGGPL